MVSLLLVKLAWSQERAIRPARSEASTVTRQALVIGNSEYEYAGRLRNPLNDARAIGITLQEPGFELTTLTNSDESKFIYTRSSLRIGSLRTRLPVAAKTAFATAGPMTGVQVSPILPCLALLATRCTLIGGVSFNFIIL